MHRALLTITIAAGLAVACSDDGASKATPTSSAREVDLADVCALLSPADFASQGFTVNGDGVDVSDNFNLATTSSAACQWTNFDDNVGGSWELVVGTGDAEAAFDFDLEFAELDTVTRPDLGDEAYFADKVSSFDSDDHDFEAGVRIGDTYFTLSTTDDRGADAVMALAVLVVARL